MSSTAEPPTLVAPVLGYIPVVALPAVPLVWDPGQAVAPFGFQTGLLHAAAQVGSAVDVVDGKRDRRCGPPCSTSPSVEPETGGRAQGYSQRRRHGDRAGEGDVRVTSGSDAPSYERCHGTDAGDRSNCLPKAPTEGSHCGRAEVLLGTDTGAGPPAAQSGGGSSSSSGGCRGIGPIMGMILMQLARGEPTIAEQAIAMLQDLLDSAKEKQEELKDVANFLVGNDGAGVWLLSRTDPGSRLLQHVLTLVPDARDTVVSQFREIVVSQLSSHVQEAWQDHNAHHVLQKCIEVVPVDRVMPFVSAMQPDAILVARHPYGCRVLQRLIEHCSDNRGPQGQISPFSQLSEQLAREAMREPEPLATAKFGTYVVQHLLEHGTGTVRTIIAQEICACYDRRQLRGVVLTMPGAFVVQKALERCEEKHELAQLLLGPGPSEVFIDNLRVRKSKFGSFVWKTAAKIGRH